MIVGLPSGKSSRIVASNGSIVAGLGNQTYPPLSSVTRFLGKVASEFELNSAFCGGQAPSKPLSAIGERYPFLLGNLKTLLEKRTGRDRTDGPCPAKKEAEHFHYSVILSRESCLRSLESG